MLAFLSCPEASIIARQFPGPGEFQACWMAIPKWARQGLVSLVLSEGVPATFIENPLVFDQIRQAFAGDLHIAGKQITAVGSARLGYSLAPPPKWGKPFSNSSDLDLAVVSDTLFGALREAFEAWRKSVAQSGIPEGRRYRYWKENLGLLPKNIEAGFIDPIKIPTEYEPTGKIACALRSLKVALQRTPQCPQFLKPTARVYRDWESLVRRVVFNLNSATRLHRPSGK